MDSRRPERGTRACASVCVMRVSRDRLRPKYLPSRQFRRPQIFNLCWNSEKYYLIILLHDNAIMHLHEISVRCSKGPHSLSGSQTPRRGTIHRINRVLSSFAMYPVDAAVTRTVMHVVHTRQESSWLFDLTVEIHAYERSF